MGQLLEWEAALSLDPTVPPGLREALDRVALLGEEVDAGLRPEAEPQALVESFVRRLTEQARAS